MPLWCAITIVTGVTLVTRAGGQEASFHSVPLQLTVELDRPATVLTQVQTAVDGLPLPVQLIFNPGDAVTGASVNWSPPHVGLHTFTA